MRDEILNHWQIQEGLLQSYRSLFLTSQSIIFSIASIIATNQYPDKFVFTFLLLPGLVILFLWWDIGIARGLDVSYFQMLLLKNEKGEKIENILTNFKQWQKEKITPRKQKIKLLKEFELSRSVTRRRLEIYLPVVFLVLWILLSIKTYFF